MILKLIKKNKLLKNSYLKVGDLWVDKKLQTVLPFLYKNKKILDIGSGSGMVTRYLRNKNFGVVGLDVGSHEIAPDLKPVLYDGENMPFGNHDFDTGLLLTVLHHTTSPRAVLVESMRVCKEVIIIEDVYDNKLQQYATYLMDTLVNFGHSEMTYQNKTEKEWEQLFKELDYTVLSKKSKPVLLFFRQVTYHLSKNKQVFHNDV